MKNSLSSEKPPKLATPGMKNTSFKLSVCMQKFRTKHSSSLSNEQKACRGSGNNVKPENMRGKYKVKNFTNNSSRCRLILSFFFSYFHLFFLRPSRVRPFFSCINFLSQNEIKFLSCIKNILMNMEDGVWFYCLPSPTRTLLFVRVSRVSLISNAECSFAFLLVELTPRREFVRGLIDGFTHGFLLWSMTKRFLFCEGLRLGIGYREKVNRSWCFIYESCAFIRVSCLMRIVSVEWISLVIN